MRNFKPLHGVVALVCVCSALYLVGCGGSSAPYSPTVENPTGTVSFNLSGGGSATVAPGSSATITLNVTDIQNADGLQAVDLSASGLPEGVTMTFNPNPFPVSAENPNITATITVPAGVADGDYPFTVGAQLGSAYRSINGTLTVDSNLVVQVTGGGSQIVAPGASIQYPLTAQLIEIQNLRAAHEVTFSVEGLPEGVTSSFSANPITATRQGVTSTLTVNVPDDIFGGTAGKTRTSRDYHFTIVALADGERIELPATLVVNDNLFDFSFGGRSFVAAYAGEESSYTGTLYQLKGDDAEEVTLSVEGLPEGSTARFSPTSLTPSMQGTGFTMHITPPIGIAVGSYPIRIKGTSPSVTKTRNLSLSIYAIDR